MKFAYHTNTWGGVWGHPAGVTSVKDLFYLSNGSTDEAAADIAAAGYEGLELFDGNLMRFADRKDDFRALLAQNKLKLVAVYSGGNYIYDDVLADELWRVEQAAALAAEFGAEHLVVGGGARRSGGPRDEDYKTLARSLDKVADVAEEHGLKAHFHPHLGTIAEAPEQIARVFEHSRIGFCPDTAHLAAGGGDPVALIKRYAERISYVHLKDWRADPFAFLPLGHGGLDFAGIMQALKEADFDGWITVELDSYEDAPGKGAAISLKYLESL